MPKQEKFHRLVAPCLGGAEADRLTAAIAVLEEVEHVRELTRAPWDRGSST